MRAIDRMRPCSSSPKSMFTMGETPATMTTSTMEESSSSSSPSPQQPTPPPRSPLDVDEEYDRAFKSKSFLDLWSHAHRNLRPYTFSSFKLSSRPGSSFKLVDSDDDDEVEEDQQSCSYTVLDDFVLEPSPEMLARGSAGRRRRWHWRRSRWHGRRVEMLLLEYFDVTREACEAFSALLDAIGAARRHHLTLRRLLLRLDGDDDGHDAKDALARHVLTDNPLSPGSLPGFHEVHTRCAPLVKRLAAARRRLRRLARAARFARCTAATAVIAASAAAVVAAVVLAAHAVVGIGMAAAAVGASPAATVRWASEKAGLTSRRHYARAGATVDAAARGAYIVGRDLDTVSRMVRRAHDELEHGRDMARIAVRGHGERPLLQEVAREEEECGEDLREQLGELEEHACLCLITINRSRRMVAHEMTRGLTPSTEETPPPATTAPQD